MLLVKTTCKDSSALENHTVSHAPAATSAEAVALQVPSSGIFPYPVEGVGGVGVLAVEPFLLDYKWNNPVVLLNLQMLALGLNHCFCDTSQASGTQSKGPLHSSCWPSLPL